MPKLIQDVLTGLDIPKQRKWELRQKARGKCVSCTRRRVKGDYCMRHYLKHKDVNKNAMRKRAGWET